MTGRGTRTGVGHRSYYKAAGHDSACRKAGRGSTTPRSSTRPRQHRAQPVGPKRPQGSRQPADLGRASTCCSRPDRPNGYAAPPQTSTRCVPSPSEFDVCHGDVLESPRITSCTTLRTRRCCSPPDCWRKKARSGKRPQVSPRVKTSLAPGSKVSPIICSDGGLLPHPRKTRLQRGRLRLHDCMARRARSMQNRKRRWCRRTSSPAPVALGQTATSSRVHANLRANYLASPALVVAYAIAGTVRTDLTKDPVGTGADGKPVYLKTCGRPTPRWLADENSRRTQTTSAASTATCRATRNCGKPSHRSKAPLYKWIPKSTFIKEPPFLTA